MKPSPRRGILNRLAYKRVRLAAYASALGWLRALRFELAWSARRPLISVRVPNYPAPFTIRRHSSDSMVFKQVFADEDLGAFLPENPRLIVDGGAYVGYSTAFYARRFPNARVIAVEPSDANSEMLLRNCAAYQNVDLVRGALWPVEGVLRITNPEGPEWAFKVHESSRAEGAGIQAWPIEQILARSGCERIDLLKLDVEGAEEALFKRGVEDWLPRVDAMVIEVHSETAMAVIDGVTPEAEFDRRQRGEKLYFIRKTSAGAPR